MTERAARVGRNEALFRSVNEKIEDINESFGPFAGDYTMVCECGNTACIDQIRIGHDAYERLRQDPRLFAMKPGHELPDVETVIAHHEEYVVVWKDEGLPERIALATDPRAGD